jgi:cytochrome P450
LNYYPNLFIRDPVLLNELYVTKNKFFDKFDLTRNLFYPLMGDSILLSSSSDQWNQKRKSLSAAFYKDKLLKMLELVKQCMTEKV